MIDRLDVVVLPCAGEKVLLPAQLVNQVLPYTSLMLHAEVLDCVVGNLIIQDEKLPVVQLFRSSEVYGDSAKLVWLRSVQRHRLLSGYILLADYMPKTITLSQEDIVEEVQSDVPYMAYQVRLRDGDYGDGFSAFIPDLDNLQTDLEG